MKTGKILKRILISAGAVVLAAGAGLGAWHFLGQSSAEPVPVFSFYNIGMTEYWGDSRETYGPVTTDRMQTVYLTDTQTVTGIHVTPGQSVKKGDLLMTYDTTLNDLSLERKRLEVEKLKLELMDARERLAEITRMRPMVIPSYDPGDDTPPEVNPGTAIPAAYTVSPQKEYDGSTADLAMICWLRHDTAMDDALWEALRQTSEAYRKHNAAIAPPAADSEETASAATGDEPVPESTEAPAEEPTPVPTEAPAEEPTPAPTDAPAVEPTPAPTDAPAVDPTPVPTDAPIDLTVDQYYVICKVTEGDMSLGATQVWQGLEVTRDPVKGTFSLRFFDASYLSDYTRPQEDAPVIPDSPQMDFGSGFTADQIAEMRAEQEKAIKDLEFRIRMTEADYKIMLTEAGDGCVYAAIDGEVVSLLAEDEARETMQPLIKVSGGGGFYIQGRVSELGRDLLAPGQEVTVNDWNTGMVHVGVIESVGDYPATDNSWDGWGNPNSSYYPFRVFVDGSADMQEGSYVSVTYGASAAESGIYLENMFLRSENGRSYVFLRGADGSLEQRFVTTGRSLWGSYTEILSGIVEEDLIAFPYGKNVRAGVPTVESDISVLYEN